MHHDSQPLPDGPRPRLVDWGRELSVHSSWLKKVIFARSGEWQAVEDLFQQVALAALAQQAPLADPNRAAAWLHRLAVIKSARYRRQQGRSRRTLAGFAQRTAPSWNGDGQGLLNWLVKKERHQQVAEAMTRLTGRDAEILLLKYAENWSYREIADRLGISDKAVDRRLDRARKHLREELCQMGIQGVES